MLVEWTTAVEQAATGAARRILLLGAPDVGKSTFCRALLQEARRAGRSAALLDTDLGQKLVGPPSCVTLGRGTSLSLSGLHFADALEPLRGWRQLLAGAIRLAGEAEDASLLIVNTSGLLAGPGRRLKAAKIAALRPDLLVAIGRDRALEAVLSDHQELPLLRLAPSPLARRKSDGERRALRRAAFRAYFGEAPCWWLDLRKLRTETARPEPLPGRRRLLALGDGRGRDLALGVALDATASGAVKLRAHRPAEEIALLRWGELRLEEDGSARADVPPSPSPAQPDARNATASAAMSDGTAWPPANSR